MPSQGILWTSERDEALRVAWAANVSASAIAKELGGFDHTADGGRNAVIGRVHRLGLTKQPKPNALTPEQRIEQRKEKQRLRDEKRWKRRQAERAEARAADAAREPIEVVPAPEPEYGFIGVALLDLRDFSSQQPNQCRYPDPRDKAGPNYLFCGAETLPGESYCRNCAEICRPSHSAPITNERREQLRESGRAAGYASIRSRGRVMGRSVAMATSPVLDSEVRV